MKKVILALTIAAFTVTVQAGEACAKDKAAWASKDKPACTAKADSACCAKTGSVAQTTCPVRAQAACSTKKGCAKKLAAKKWLMSPKAAGELASAR